MFTKIDAVRALARRLASDVVMAAWDIPDFRLATSVRIEIVRGDTALWSQERQLWPPYNEVKR